MALLIDQIIGHKGLKDILSSAIQQNRVVSSYLFVGPSGVGKKIMARAFAQLLICEKKNGCGLCSSCLRIVKDQHENLILIEPSGLQVKIEQVRPLKDLTKFRLLGRARVAIINEAHAMTPQAANTLLKLLEEPPENTHFILISSQEGGILPTLKSRSQILRFSPLSLEDLQKHRPSSSWILQSSQGRMDRLELYQDPDIEKLRKPATQAYSLNLEGDRIQALLTLAPLIKEKENAVFVLSLWQSLVRDTWYTKLGHPSKMNPDIEDILGRTPLPSDEKLDKMSSDIMNLEREIAGNVDRQLLFENLLRQWSALT